MASVRVIGRTLEELRADLGAVERGYTSAKAERIVLENSARNRFERKAKKAARKTVVVSASNWTVDQYRRNNPNSESDALAREMNNLGIS